MTVAIETRALTKHYGGVVGCRAVDLAVPAGQVFGLLGPNGAGKSTVVKLLTGLLRPTAGSGRILGQPLGTPAANRLVGFLPEAFRLPDWPRALEVLAYYGRLAGLPAAGLPARCQAVLERVGLADAGRRRVGGFSNGMKQRLALGAALLHEPPVLILDEPTSALDPLGRRFVRNLLLDLRREGRTVLLNSHLLSEVERICDAVAIIRRGEVIAAGPMAELTGQRVEVTLRYEPDSAELQAALAALGPVARRDDGCVVLTLADAAAVPQAAAAVVGAGARLYELTPHTRSLEDLFVDLVQPGGAEVAADAHG